jgi:molybdate/tungstate transport system substrate-binding protein
MVTVPKSLVAACVLFVALGAAVAASPVHAAEQKLTIYAAGTLAVPFKQLDAIFAHEHPDVTLQPQFGGSVMMTKRVSELHQRADIVAVADYSVIPKYLFAANGKPALANWYVGFARNAVTFVYTPKSKYAGEVKPANWYKILARQGVEIGRSDPDTDPSGYQTVQMLNLAEKFYGEPKLAEKILANAPLANMRDTETSLISALQLGQIDYLAIYRSDALQHHLKYVELPPKINLSDPQFSSFYVSGVAHTKNGDLAGKPIVYAATIPNDAEHPDLAATYLELLLGPKGQKVIGDNGFGRVAPAYAVNVGAMPAQLRAHVKPWPQS